MQSCILCPNHESEVAPFNESVTYTSTKKLTQMSTLDRLLEEKRLILVTMQLPRRQFHDRKLYAFPECVEWMRNQVPKMVTGQANSAFTPKEQLRERLRQWMSGEPMGFDRVFHHMTPERHGVWEMKTADLRIFGWMYKPKQFIAVKGGYTDHYKKPTKTKFYADERREVVKARDDLPLDGQKYVVGTRDELV
jgi:hypothetical protein